MKQQVENGYGSAQTIRYLVNSLDDLQEIAQTLLFKVRRNSEPRDYEPLMRTITLSAIPMAQSLSSFIIGLDVPQNLLKAGPAPNGDTCRNRPDETLQCTGFLRPHIHTEEHRHHVSFHVNSLNDLLCSLMQTMDLLQNGSERFEYINMKRRTRLQVTPAEPAAGGFILTCKIPELPDLR